MSSGDPARLTDVTGPHTDADARPADARLADARLAEARLADASSGFAAGPGQFPIETERLFIRPFEPGDADAIFETWGDPVVMRRIPSGSHSNVETSRQKIARFREHQAAHGFSLWPVIEKASGRILGDCGLLLVEWTGPDVELAYRFGRAAWGKGYATEAARACLRYGFEVVRLAEIIAVTHPDHLASRRVMEKCGMRFVGTVRHYGLDLVQYVRTASDHDGERSDEPAGDAGPR